MAPLRTLTLPPATHTNAYIFGARELVVIDPGSPFEDEQAGLEGELARLEAGGARLRAILLTHHHQDHAAGAASLAARSGAPVWAHAVTAQLLDGMVAVERTLDDGEVIELAGDPPRRLRALFTPGHAPGHLCFLEEETGFAAVGDMVAGIGTILIEPSEGDMRQYLASLAKLAAAGPRALLPAHGPPIADPARKIEEYIRHRLWREERVAGALAARGRATARDLVPDAYSDVVPALFGRAERSLVAHHVKLAGDGRARLVGDEWEVV
jgi:glyoxylase-like metal-dependent hydrolase (beta-lactamase superfamily II)